MILVVHILSSARKRLAKLRPESGVCEAAAILMSSETPLVVVCNGSGVTVGVVTRTDVIRALANAQGDALTMSVDAIMTAEILSCRAHQPLRDVWKRLDERSLRCAPVLDSEGRPQGVLHARDIAGALLEEVTSEEDLLRDYVLGIGYQ